MHNPIIPDACFRQTLLQCWLEIKDKQQTVSYITKHKKRLSDKTGLVPAF